MIPWTIQSGVMPHALAKQCGFTQPVARASDRVMPQHQVRRHLLGQRFDGDLPLGPIDLHKLWIVLETELYGFRQVPDGALVPVGQVLAILIRK